MSLEEQAQELDVLRTDFFVEGRAMSMRRRTNNESTTLITPVDMLHYDFCTLQEGLEEYVSRQAKSHKALEPYLNGLLGLAYEELAVLVKREQAMNSLRETTGGRIAHTSCKARASIFSLFGSPSMGERYNRAIMLERGNVYGCEQLLAALTQGTKCLDLVTRTYDSKNNSSLIEWQLTHEDLLFIGAQLLHVAHKKLDNVIDEKSFFFPKRPYVLIA